MKKQINTVNTLIESFPYIKEFHGKTIVIKYGGHAMQQNEIKQSFARDMVLLKYVGINPVIIHGGGPQISSLLEQLGIASTFADGLRITDEKTMEIAEMVLVGNVNKEIVRNINMEGGKAVGLSGKDGGLILARKTYHHSKGEKIDIGQVGEVQRINSKIIEVLDKENFIPVIAPIGVDGEGTTFNINSDTVAGKIAESLKAEKLILLTDKEGVKINNEFTSTLNDIEIQNFIDKGEIQGGMIPKVKCCIDAINGGVNKAHIIDGRVEHAVLLEIFTDAGIGTEIVGS